MEKKYICQFDSAHGPVVVKEIIEYSLAPKWQGEARVARFIGNDEKIYIADLQDLVLKAA